MKTATVTALAFWALLSAYFVQAGTVAPQSAAKPNIIFIFADDWGYGDLGIHGSTFCKTPNLDRMAAQGIDFQDFTVASPVCSPSRTAVLTGQYPARNSVHEHFATVQHHIQAGMPDWLDPLAPMLPRMLRAAGYVTGHFGKWHLSNDMIPDGPLPTAYGYDEFGAFNLPGDAPEQMNTKQATPRAVDFIRRHKAQPFFINLWIHEAHTPHYPVEKYLNQFTNLDEQKQVYAAVIAEGDAEVGAILASLKELGLDEKTLVVFSSDNGPEWTGTGAHKHADDTSTGPGLDSYYSVGETDGLKGRKRSLYAGGIRVPFIARWPGVVPAGRVDRKSALTAVDLLPTFLEVAGQPLPTGYQPDGQSILAALKGKDFQRRTPIFWEWPPANNGHSYYWPRWGMREGRWQLLVNEKLNKLELYNVADDWAEATDVSSEHPEVVARLTKTLHEWEATLPKDPPASCFSKLRTKEKKE